MIPQSDLFELLHEVEKSPTALVSAKRGPAERKTVHSWHPYYAGYSEAFVASALGYLEADAATLVLDPWGGSGTTNAVSARMGVPALSLDINPVMATFSAAKSPEVLEVADGIEAFFASLPLLLAERDCEPTDALLKLFEPATARTLRNVIEAIPFRGHKEGPDDVDEPAASAPRDAAQIVNAAHAFCMAVVFVTIREVSGATAAANPTWLKTAENKAQRDHNALLGNLARNARSMLGDLRTFFYGRNALMPSYVLAGDARKLPIRAKSVDRIVTSPPYLTRIDYAISTAPEMAAFGGDDLVTFVRHATMGAPVITKNGRCQKQEWGPLCNSVLDAVKNHPTKAASSYYWKNIVQYFQDLDAALDEVVRVLKSGGKGLIVVQSSFFKEIEIPLGDIYVQMAEARGLSSHIAFREEVRGHLAHVNTRSNVYKANKIFFEDFVFIQKP